MADQERQEDKALRDQIAQRLAEALDGQRFLDAGMDAERIAEFLADAVLPVVQAHERALRQVIADYLLTHVGGDETQQWQAGHNHAMREAARLVREGHDQL